MKRKLFLTIMILMLTIVMLAACNKDVKHNFSEEWSNNETHHWHACADKDCKETKDKAEHSWNDGSVTVEPTTEKEGTMLYVCTVCHREKTAKIDKLVAEKEYTITFDSKGGSAVQPVKASAGAAITAPAAPTKEGFVFAGWYESADGGETLSDKEFDFAYMPARVFTLYAKWATADIKGKTFNKVDATFEWESEAVKQAFLAEMEITEEQFIQNHKVSTITLVFAADKDSVTATFDQNPGEEDDKGKGVATLLYKIKGSAIVFYDSREDMEKEIPAHEMGLFVGSTFELSADKTTIIQSNIQPGMGTIKYKYSVEVK
ncbi:MAG TPA: hypothetical protein DHU79_07055 [Clostridiales bacterium]|nr:hypothetical protein [Clostridiales bacterium]